MTRPGSKGHGGGGVALGPPAGAAGVLERVLGWWARRFRPAPAELWTAARDETATFLAGGGLALTCRAGTFLVTQEGDRADHVLARGETFRAAPRGRVAAWALAPGVLEVRGGRRNADGAARSRSGAARELRGARVG